MTITEVHSNPEHIYIEPTLRCNTRCRHCGHYYSRFGGDMAEDVADRALRTIDNAKVIELIGYGEPLMAAQYDKLYKAAVETGSEIWTTTNGILLKDDESVARFVKNKVTLTLSIDGATKETFEHIRPYIKWEKLVERLERIKRVREEVGSPDFKLAFNFVAMKSNIADLPGLVQLAHDFGAFRILVLPLALDPSYKEVLDESLEGHPELLSEPFFEALRLGKKYGVEVMIPGCYHHDILAGKEKRRGIWGQAQYYRRKFELAALRLGSGQMHLLLDRFRPKRKYGGSKVTGFHCNKPWNSTYIAANGTVHPCCHMIEMLGNVEEHDWDDIWNGALYRNMRRNIHGWNPPEVCRQCPLPFGIGGGNMHAYDQYFEKFTARNVGLESRAVELVHGIGKAEKVDDGFGEEVEGRRISSHAKLRVRTGRRARFLRLVITPRAAGDYTTPGIYRVNGGKAQPFDNSAKHVHIPLFDHDAGAVEIELKFLKTEHERKGPWTPALLAMEILR